MKKFLTCLLLCSSLLYAADDNCASNKSYSASLFFAGIGELREKEIQKLLLDCKQRPYVFIFRKLLEPYANDLKSILSDDISIAFLKSMGYLVENGILYKGLSIEDFAVMEKEKRFEYSAEMERLFDASINDGTFVSKQDLKSKLIAGGFPANICQEIIKIVDKNNIALYKFIATDHTSYALIVAKRKFTNYINGEVFHD